MKPVALFASESARPTVVRGWNAFLGLFPRASHDQRHSIRSRFGLHAALPLLCAAIAVCAMCAPAFSQINTGRVLGTVTDQSGGAIAAAAVVVTNPQTGVARNLTADAAGEYVAPDLTPGTYTVRCTETGFKAFERQNVLVDVGQDARVDCQLTPGQVTQTIQVTESSLQLDTSSAVVSGTLNTDTIVDLPLKARNYQDFLALRPGVMQTPGGGTLTNSVHGLAPSQNNNFIEGLDTNDPITGQNITNTTLPFGDAGTILPIDAIQEINIETNAPAEFGRRPGAVINVGLKTGGNAIHGEGFAFGRDDVLDATDLVIPAVTRQPMSLEQWGGTFGGPIVKNKLFYFGAFERESYNVGNAFATQTPTLTDMGNSTTAQSQSIPSAERALANAGMTVSPLSQHLLQYYGSPNNNPTSAITIGFPDIFAINNVVGKVDYHPSDHHTLTGSYFWGNGSAVGEDSGYTEQIFDTIGSLKAQLLATSWTWTPNSTWVNDLRFGWNRYLRNTQTGDYLTPVTSYGLDTGVASSQLQGFPIIAVNGLASIGGGNKSPRNFGPGNDYDLVDHVSYLHGKHAFKFGGEMLYLNTFFDQIPNGRGTFTFTGGSNTCTTCAVANPLGSNITSLEAFLAGIPDTNSGASILEGSPARTYVQWDFSGFFEDSWRATSKLTVNAGVRYEYNTPLGEIHNLIGNWSPTAGLEQVGFNIKSVYNPYYKDISPRIGVAWDVSGKGTTVIRAGFGIYYDNPAAAAFIGLQGSLPAQQIGIQAIPTGDILYDQHGNPSGPIVPNGGGMSTQTVAIAGQQVNWTLNAPANNPMLPAFSPTSLTCGTGQKPVAPVAAGVNPNVALPPPCSIFAIDPNLPSPMITSWNVGVQHALTPAVAVEANYIGNHGSRLTGVVDMNQVSAANQAITGNDTQQFLPFYSAATSPSGVAYPYLQYIDYQTDSEISNYNALEVTLTARNFHRLSILAGYTFSRALSEEPGTGYSIQQPQNPANPMGDYGPTGFDVRNNFTLSPTYVLPSKKSPLQLLEGWSIQSAILIHGGFAWTASTTTNISNTNEKKDRWDFFGNPSDFNQVNGQTIPWYSGSNIGAMPAACTNAASSIGTTATTLVKYGCFAQGSSALIAPPLNSFGTETRGEFRGPAYANWDFSIFKNTKIREWMNAQFRAEFYNIINHPNLATGSGSISGSSENNTFAQPNTSWDQSSTNPVLGTGGARTIQFGLKLLF
jgi:Carboxypeptidase regulatory-like domain